jgi:thymidine phosphorylase
MLEVGEEVKHLMVQMDKPHLTGIYKDLEVQEVVEMVVQQTVKQDLLELQILEVVVVVVPIFLKQMEQQVVVV